jgi:hypothetical protein
MQSDHETATSPRGVAADRGEAYHSRLDLDNVVFCRSAASHSKACTNSKNATNSRRLMHVSSSSYNSRNATNSRKASQAPLGSQGGAYTHPRAHTDQPPPVPPHPCAGSISRKWCGGYRREACEWGGGGGGGQGAPEGGGERRGRGLISSIVMGRGGGRGGGGVLRGGVMERMFWVCSHELEPGLKRSEGG